MNCSQVHLMSLMSLGLRRDWVISGAVVPSSVGSGIATIHLVGCQGVEVVVDHHLHHVPVSRSGSVSVSLVGHPQGEVAAERHLLPGQRLWRLTPPLCQEEQLHASS